MTETETWEGEGGAIAMPPDVPARSRIHCVTDALREGSILIAEEVRLPNSMLVRLEPYSGGWSAVTDERTRFEKDVENAGWTFFYMAGEIKVTVFDFHRPKALRAAWTRLAANIRSQGCNCIEITRVVSSSFLRLPHVSIYAHARHLQMGRLFNGQRNLAESRKV